MATGQSESGNLTAGILLRVLVDAIDLASAVTISYDTDNDGSFDDTDIVTFEDPGAKTIRVKASSLGGEKIQNIIITVTGLNTFSGDITLDQNSTAEYIAGFATYQAVSGSLNIWNTSLSSLEGLENIVKVN